MQKAMPRYPVYIPSKGRADKCLTARMFSRDGVPFYLVVEEQERAAYAAHFGNDRLLILPFSNQGSGIPARNWIKERATKAGHKRHWQFDDNICRMTRRWNGKRVPCDAGVALTLVEDFTERYENVAISGFNYEMFAPNGQKIPPFNLNVHIYSATLILNELPYQWRGKYNEDTDYCLQVLTGGWCTVLFNAFLVFKVRSMKMGGGNTKELYRGDGRLKMARSLERMWPGVVETRRRFGRPQHAIKYAWRKFDTPLKLKAGIDLEAMQPSEHGIRLKQVNDEIKSDELRQMVEEYKGKHG